MQSIDTKQLASQIVEAAAYAELVSPAHHPRNRDRFILSLKTLRTVAGEQFNVGAMESLAQEMRQLGWGVMAHYPNETELSFIRLDSLGLNAPVLLPAVFGLAMSDTPPEYEEETEIDFAPKGYKQAHPVCPICHSKQVQLLTMRVTPAPYCCRHCKHTFQVALEKIESKGAEQ